MAEPRRLEFTTIDTNNKAKKPDAKRLHHRFMLTLSESNATTCPEFSYAELWKNVVVSVKKFIKYLTNGCFL